VWPKINKYFISFVYIEPVVKYWKKNEFMVWPILGGDNKCNCPMGTLCKCEKRDKLLCFLLCLLCYLCLDKTVLVFHSIHRTHLDEIFCLNILKFSLLFKVEFWVLIISWIKGKWKGSINQRRGKSHGRFWFETLWRNRFKFF